MVAVDKKVKYSAPTRAGRGPIPQEGREAGHFTLPGTLQEAQGLCMATEGLRAGVKGFGGGDRLPGKATHTVISPLRGSVKLPCIGGWANLYGPIEARFPPDR